jgi:hypothetical protein
MRTQHPRVRQLAVVVSLAVLLTAAGPAQAKNPPPVKVDLLSCLFGVETFVEPGQPFVLDLGWAALTIPHEILFLLSARTVASIDGTPIQHANRYWRLPQKTYPFPDLPWNMAWNYPVGPLSSGESITVAYEWILRFPISDGVDTYPRGPVLEPFGAMPCTITAL